jgi:hypothetical protein
MNGQNRTGGISGCAAGNTSAVLSSHLNMRSNILDRFLDSEAYSNLAGLRFNVYVTSGLRDLRCVHTLTLRCEDPKGPSLEGRGSWQCGAANALVAPLLTHSGSFEAPALRASAPQDEEVVSEPMLT